MGLWDRIRGVFGGAPAKAADPALVRADWRFVNDDGEWTARIAGEPDASMWPVFADWLEERGDARAELIRRALAGDAFEAFVDANAAQVLGLLAGRDRKPHSRSGRPLLELEWRNGLVRGAGVRTDKVWDDVGHLLRLPVARYLVRLSLGLGDNPLEPVTNAETLQTLASPAASHLRSLFLGDFEYPTESEMSWALVGDVSALWTAAPRLRDVKLRGVVEDLGQIFAPNLVRFTRETGSLKRSELSSIVEARWPKLEHLELWFGETNYGAEPTADDAAPLLELDGVPALTSLGICNFEFTDALVERIVASPLLPRLKRLDLSRGCLTDEGAMVLLQCRDRLAHLSELDLSQNLLSEGLEADLKKLCAGVKLDGQRLADMEEIGPGSRYVAVGE